RAPELQADSLGRVWMLASGRLVGLDSAGQRYELSAGLGKFTDAQFFAIDPKNRFWLFRGLGRRASFVWMASWRNAALQRAVVDSAGLQALDQTEAALGYDAP